MRTWLLILRLIELVVWIVAICTVEKSMTVLVLALMLWRAFDAGVKDATYP